MKFCILMWYDENIALYGDINYKINKKYCDKNNIELIRCAMKEDKVIDILLGKEYL